MARFTLQITCDNAAFDGDPLDEVARILQVAARQVEDHLSLDGQIMRRLQDANGNTVGDWTFEPKED